MDHIYTSFEHLLTECNLPFLLVPKLEEYWGSTGGVLGEYWRNTGGVLGEYCNAIYNKGAPLRNCFGFVDGTVRPICRPGTSQRVVYNGHKKVHALKFQSIVLPNGLIGNMYGPIEGRRHDCFMLRMSGILPKLQQYAFNANGDPLCIYGDPAYPLRIHLQAPFKNARLQPLEQQFNTSMSKVRVSVEWLVGDICNWFAFMDFEKNLKLNLNAVGKMYLVCVLLTNARTCCTVIWLLTSLTVNLHL